jgi:hypothetical protein
MQAPPPYSAPSFQGDVPIQLQYNAAVPSATLKSETFVRNFTCENQGTFSPANPVIRIPVVSQGGFLNLTEAKLCFDFTLQAGLTSAILDGGAQCCIQQLRILSPSGNEVERVPGYNLIAPVIDQYTDTRSTLATKNSAGGNPGSYMTRGSDMYNVNSSAPGVAADAVTAGQTITYSAFRVSGLSDELSCESADTINASVMRSYQIPLTAMGWFNPSMGKLLPPGVAFILEVTLAPALACLTFDDITAHTACDYSWQNTLLKIPNTIVHDEGFMASVAQLKAGGMSWGAQTFKQYTNTLTGAAAVNTINISDRSRSLNALIGILRAQSKVMGALTDAVKLFKLSKRSLQYCTQWQYTIGSDLYPPQPIKFKVNTNDDETDADSQPITAALSSVNITDAWTEAKKVFGPNGSLTRNNFANAMAVLDNGMGVFCVDLQSYHTDKRATSGLDTASTASPVTLRITTASFAGTPVIQCDIFARCDIQFVVVPGTGELRGLV